MTAGTQARVAVFAGPSGGHLFPALAFLEEFRSKYPQSRLSLITSRRARGLVEASFPAELRIEVYYLPEFPSPSGFSLSSLLFLLKLARAFFYTAIYLNRFRPDIAVGFGSFVSYPGIWLAARSGVPTLIHEQNVIAGKATRWLLRSADCAALSFADTRTPAGVKQREVTGLPVRQAICRRAAETEAAPRRSEAFRLLVVGGSQGALKLNRLVLEAVSGLSSEEKGKVAVTHITGTQDLEVITQGYREIKVQHRTHAFYGAMQDLYAEADMAITRAGANTLFELALFGIPSFVVPYPYAGAHQTDNARYFESRGGVLTSQQHELTGTKLRDAIRSMMQNQKHRDEFAGKIRQLATPQAAGRLVNLAESLMNRKRSGESQAVREQSLAGLPQA